MYLQPRHQRIQVLDIVCSKYRTPARLYHVEHDFPKIATGLNSPFLKQRVRHWPKLAKCHFADPCEQLLTGHMSGAALAIFDNCFLRMV